jgi:hypothetical protein
MRLNDEVLKLVVYLGWPGVLKGGEVFDVEGSGFLLDSGGTKFVVTAAHVARTLDSPFGIRMNNKEGRAQTDHVQEPNWIFHPTNPLADVAVMKYEPPEWADVDYWIPKWSITDFKRRTKNIGPGDLAYIVGAYYFLPGEKTVTPIVHTGHIAMMSDEPIPMQDWRAPEPEKADPIETYGYLIEAQTLPTLSGSPVFVRRSVGTKQIVNGHNEGAPLKVWLHGSLWLLGLWQGTWFADPSAALKLRGRPLKVNVGMGVTVPAVQLLATLPESHGAKNALAKALASAPDFGQSVAADGITTLFSVDAVEGKGTFDLD